MSEAINGSGHGSLLEAQQVRQEFGGVTALDDVSLTINGGEIVGLIGPNGAGKTTVINALSGFLDVTGGRVLLDDRDVTKWPPWRRARNGLTRSFQGVRLFDDLTVAENLAAGALGTGVSRSEARRRVEELIGRISMEDRADFKASTLPAGDQRRVGIMRAAAADPAFVLLDEPAAGLNDEESAGLVDLIKSIRDDYQSGVLVIEHDMRVIMPLCDRIYVLNNGGVLASGSPSEIRANPEVIVAYLGTSEGADAGS